MALKVNHPDEAPLFGGQLIADTEWNKDHDIVATSGVAGDILSRNDS